MSSIDSALNSLAAVTLEDVFNLPPARQGVWIPRVTTLFWVCSRWSPARRSRAPEPASSRSSTRSARLLWSAPAASPSASSRRPSTAEPLCWASASASRGNCWWRGWPRLFRGYGGTRGHRFHGDVGAPADKGLVASSDDRLASPGRDGLTSAFVVMLGILVLLQRRRALDASAPSLRLGRWWRGEARAGIVLTTNYLLLVFGQVATRLL